MVDRCKSVSLPGVSLKHSVPSVQYVWGLNRGGCPVVV